MGAFLNNQSVGRALLLAVAATICAPACTVDDGPAGRGPSAPPRNVASGPCTAGESRACSIDLGDANGIKSCYRGSQTCTGGLWSACVDGEVTNLTPPDPSDWQTKALTNASDCVFNPCDPQCMHYDEEVGTWDAQGSASSFGWPWGDPDDVPQAAWDKAYNEPCATGADCQMNSFCFDPISESCGHDVCSIGGGLELGCGSCADAVCAAHPECCEKEYGGATCGHSECEAGVALADGCSSCAASICSYDAYCCTTAWDATCAGYTQTDAACTNLCDDCPGQACAHDTCTSGVALDASCDACVADVCAYDSWCCSDSWDSICVSERDLFSSCAFSGSGSQVCTHDPCQAGTALVSGCANDVDTVCAAEPSCCTSAWDASCVALFNTLSPGGCPSSWPGDWDQTCVNAVEDACGAYCDASPTGEGICVPWNPGETNPGCNGVDLSVGLTCDDAVPVCNHGTQTAVAPITVVHMPENSGYFADPNPPASVSGSVTCSTTQDIPPGYCVPVDCPGITADREIMVNPPNGNADHVAECNALDNWGIYVPGTCGLPSCANESVTAQIKPVNMFIAMDKSGSMGGSRWTSSVSAFTTFFQDAGTDGLGIALEFFPQSGCYASSSECGSPSNCAAPYVGLDTLSAAAAPTDSHEAALVAAFAAFSPGGSTPASLAFDGCHEWAANYTASHPDEQQICVLVTDGFPTTCDTSQSAFTTAAADGFNNYGVLSYGIGIVGADQVLLDAIAAAGNGQSFYVGNANVEQDLLNALLAIKGQALSCDLELPPGNYDPTQAIVEITPGNGGATATIDLVADAGSCGSDEGWYLDDPSNPSTITMCPTTCSGVQADTDSVVELTFPCQSTLAPTTYTEVYEATCPEPKLPQWGFFGYDTDTPAGTNVEFKASWADSEAELATAPMTTLGTAEPGPPDTSVCSLGANISGCPINLFNAAGRAPDGHRSWMRIDATLNPNAAMTAGPSVTGYDVTYTCIDAL